MGKMYTLDGKLLTELPELRVGAKLYPVDNRTKTVKAMMKLSEQKPTDANTDYMTSMEQALVLALGEAAVKEIGIDDMPFPAYQQLFELVLAAATGEDPKLASAQGTDSRFQPVVG